MARGARPNNPFYPSVHQLSYARLGEPRTGGWPNGNGKHGKRCWLLRDPALVTSHITYYYYYFTAELD